MQRVDTDAAPALRSFATGLDRDLDAVTAGLTLSYSSGPVEGTVTRDSARARSGSRSGAAPTSSSIGTQWDEVPAGPISAPARRGRTGRPRARGEQRQFAGIAR